MIKGKSPTGDPGVPPYQKLPRAAKPPLGIKPKYIHEIQRANELAAAINRYLEHGMREPCLIEWTEELAELTKQIATDQ